MKKFKTILWLIVLIGLLSACGRIQTKVPGDQATEETGIEDRNDVSSSEIIKETAREAINALRDKDMEKISKLVHPEKGVRFSPYAFVDVKNDLVFAAADVKDLLSDTTIYTWGSFDGTGDPIELTFEEYYKKFIYDADFANAEQVGYNEILGKGNTIENSAEVYKDSVIVEYHFSGIDPQYEGMDWRSLRIVFEKFRDTWYIVGIIHDQWTV
ncbi:MAG: hypothetical protein GX022_06290 [Clostridiaceae bacterium]|nr:hypothetical protein [Clostridiaceae bacterium]